MRKLVLLVVLGLLCWAVRGQAANDRPVNVPVVKDAAASQALVEAARKAGRCYATDLMTADAGTLVRGSTEDALAAGRYRLHALVALAPLGDLKISAITVTVKAGGAQRNAITLHFPNPDEFIDLPVEFVSDGGEAPVSISWAIIGEQAKKNRIKALDAPKGPDDEEDTEPVILDAPKIAEDGTISVKDLPKYQYRLAVCGLHVEPLCPVAVTDITTDKIIYKPGETGNATAVLKNMGNTPVKANLTAYVDAGMSEGKEVATATLDLAAGESKTWTGQFATKGLYWGHDLRVRVQTPDARATEQVVAFGVASNIWECAIVTGMMYSDVYSDLKVAEDRAEGWKRAGFTAFESGFWAPDEFGDFTPDQELWFGGQGGYRETVSGTKNICAESLKRGIAPTVYSNLWGGDGAPAFEMMRKHPDWIQGAGFSSDWLENWSLQEKGKVRPLLVWPLTEINRKNSDEALKVHAAEFVAAHKMFGWQATRYDSYYSDDWVKPSTKRVRELVAEKLPDYQWGYNSLVPKDVAADALDVMVGGGGLVMEEGIRGIVKRPWQLTHYADVVFKYRDTVWPHGGHFGVCYDKAEKDGTIADELYLSTFLLASGSHPYYGMLDRVVGDHLRFALRYAEFIYNNKMRPLKTPETVIKFGREVNLLEWKRAARTVSLGGERYRLVLHLLNPPADDMSLHNHALKVNPPIRNLPVTLALPAGAKVSGVWTLAPVPAPHHTAIPHQLAGTTLSLTVPEVRIWTMVVIDYTAKEGVQ